MADEDVVVAAFAPPEEAPVPQLSDLEKKRKLGDLESEASEPLTGNDSQQKHDGESEAPNANLEEKAEDESELKRPRLEDNVEQPALASENGHKVENDDDVVSKIEGTSNLEEGEGLEQIPESSLPVQEPPTEQHQKDDSELVSAENDKPKAESGGEEKEEFKAEAEEPSAVGGDTTHRQELVSDGETTSKKMDVPNNKVGVLIGKAGDTIRFLQYNSGAKIQIMRDAEADPRAPTRPVELIGTLESIMKAERLINDVIAEADAGGSPSLVARGFSTVQSVVGDQVEIQVPNEKVGLIIGKGGETIKSLQTKSGARIQLVPQHLPAGDQSKERTVRVTGDRKQIEMAREMIKEVMTQPVRPSPLSSGGGYHQPAFQPRGPVAPQWTNRGHPGPYMGYDYHRGPSQNSQYSAPQYGNYSQQAPRSNFGPSWEQRPPTAMHAPPQANYNYGQPQGPDYGQPGPYSQGPAPSYGQGYSEMKYDSQMQSQHAYGGHGMPQSAGGYPQGTATQPGYGPPDQYGRPGSYGMPQQGPPHSQAYGQQPRPHQPGEMPYAGPPATQAYGSSAPPQSYGYSGAVQQSYPPYGAGHAGDGYSHPPPTAAAGPGYPQPAGQPVSGYGQPAGQQPSAYANPVGGYASYPSQPGYGEQAVATNTGYGYQAPAEAAAYPSSATYGAPTTAQQGYAQPGYDQTNPQAGAYGAAPATTPAPAAVPAPATAASTPAATTGFVKSVSPQPGYPQYDSSQMYAAPR